MSRLLQRQEQHPKTFTYPSTLQLPIISEANPSSFSHSKSRPRAEIEVFTSELSTDAWEVKTQQAESRSCSNSHIPTHGRSWNNLGLVRVFRLWSKHSKRSASCCSSTWTETRHAKGSRSRPFARRNRGPDFGYQQAARRGWA